MPKNKTNKIKSEWDLTLLYKSHTDPQIEKDVRDVEKSCERFEAKYKESEFTRNEVSLAKALADYEKLIENLGGAKPLLYFLYSTHINSSDTKAEAEMNRISSRFTKASNRIIFFALKIGKIGASQQKKFLNATKLKPYRYFLENIFLTAKYDLTESEEKIMSLKSQPAEDMWVSGYEKLVSKQTIIWHKRQLPIAEAVALIPTLRTTERRALSNFVMAQLKSTSDFAEAELNAIYTNKKINDELRGFKHPYDRTILNHETDEQTVMSLVSSVTDRFNTSHRFYSLKAKLLRLKTLTYADRGAEIGSTSKKISFDQGKRIVLKTFLGMDPEFSSILEGYLMNGQIDIYPKKGKHGGAYCSSSGSTPTFVLLNHTSKFDSTLTLAHEMGHGIHAEFSKRQRPLYRGHTIAVAEVASTFFEQAVFDAVFETLSEKEKIIAFHDKLDGDMKTIFRQIACFNFEKDLHDIVREIGFVSKEEIAALMNKHMKSYLGPAFDLQEIEGYFFTMWSHIRSFFYVYSYAYGQLISRTMYKKYKEDPKYINEVKKFLEAGNSKSPYDIFKDIGIDTSNPKFWKEGLKEIEDDIKRLEKLAKEAKMI